MVQLKTWAGLWLYDLLEVVDVLFCMLMNHQSLLWWWKWRLLVGLPVPLKCVPNKIERYTLLCFSCSLICPWQGSLVLLADLVESWYTTLNFMWVSQNTSLLFEARFFYAKPFALSDFGLNHFYKNVFARGSKSHGRRLGLSESRLAKICLF